MVYAKYSPLLAFVIALSAVWWLTRTRAAHIAIDLPNNRSLHDKPIPRTGGLGLHAGVLLPCPLMLTGLPAVVWIVCSALLLVSFIDDIRGLPVIVRLAAHLAGGGIYAATAIWPEYGLLAACFVTVAIAWGINLYNFMDGADGLAGGMALFGFGFFGIVAWFAGHADFALINFSIAAAAAAFLLFNFHPARIFMGDVGAVPLGFLAVTTGLHGWSQQIWTWWFPLLIFSPFIVDASVTLARRAFSGARVWEAHREHYYQKLVRLGWSHRRTALAEYALMSLCGIAAIAGLQWSPSWQSTMLVATLILYTAIIGLVEVAWCKHCATNSNET